MTTGKKKKFKTFDELWKLDDKTLKTPKHDEMILYLLNEENIRKTVPIIDDFLKLKPESIGVYEHDHYFKCVPNFWNNLKDAKPLTTEEIITSFLRLRELKKGKYSVFDLELYSTWKKENENILTRQQIKEFEQSGKITEYLQEEIEKNTSKHGFTYPRFKQLNETIVNEGMIYHIHLDGYRIVIDCFQIQKFVDCWNEYVKMYKQTCNLRPYIETETERVIWTGSREKPFVIGYWDVVIDCYFPTSSKSQSSFWANYNTKKFDALEIATNQYNDRSSYGAIFIEVKPKIDSFGATLRQIKTYQFFQGDYSKGRTALFTDDLRFKEAFEHQGIAVFTREKNSQEKKNLDKFINK